ncbi:MAG TPA: hypothetical protein VE988_13610 [Gemmataceae bacterium]|nr:hypothetical protein [Gemmataceae bacterium]
MGFIGVVLLVVGIVGLVGCVLLIVVGESAQEAMRSQVLLLLFSAALIVKSGTVFLRCYRQGQARAIAVPQLRFATTLLLAATVLLILAFAFDPE